MGGYQVTKAEIQIRARVGALRMGEGRRRSKRKHNKEQQCALTRVQLGHETPDLVPSHLIERDALKL
jgi:hypothetical protein